jgi:hypothetical protein
MIIDKEDFEVQSSREFWAGRLIELPVNESWQIAKEIVEAIEYAKANADNARNEREVCPACYGVGVPVGEQNGCYQCKGTGQTGNCV